MKLIDAFNVYRGVQVKLSGVYVYKGVRCPVCGQYVLNARDRWVYQQEDKKKWFVCCKQCYKHSIRYDKLLTMVYAFPKYYKFTACDAPIELRSYYI